MNNVVSFTDFAAQKRAEAGPGRLVTEHRISKIMFEPYVCEVDIAGRILSGNIRYGSAFLYIEEHEHPLQKVRLTFRGFKATKGIADIPPGAQYVCSVFEGWDHAHIYLVAGELLTA